jgi:hypothetical protein
MREAARCFTGELQNKPPLALTGIIAFGSAPFDPVESG